MDAVGFAALAISLAGMLLLARKNRHGWKLRVVAGGLWVTYGAMLGAAPMVAASVTFLAVDLYGHAKSRLP